MCVGDSRREEPVPPPLEVRDAGSGGRSTTFALLPPQNIEHLLHGRKSENHEYCNFGGVCQSLLLSSPASPFISPKAVRTTTTAECVRAVIANTAVPGPV